MLQCTWSTIALPQAWHGRAPTRIETQNLVVSGVTQFVETTVPRNHFGWVAGGGMELGLCVSFADSGGRRKIDGRGAFLQIRTLNTLLLGRGLGSNQLAISLGADVPRLGRGPTAVFQ